MPNLDELTCGFYGKITEVVTGDFPSTRSFRGSNFESPCAMIDVLNAVSNYAPLIPFAVGIAIFRKLDRSSMIVLALLLLSSISQLFSRYTNRHPLQGVVFNCYLIADMVMWALVFYLNSRLTSIRLLILFVLSLEASVIFSAIRRESVWRFFSEYVSFNCVVHSTWVLLFLFERYKDATTHRLEYEPLFWFALGLLFYSPATYFLFAFYEIVRGSASEAPEKLWWIHDVVNPLMYALFTIGMIMNTRQEKLIRIRA
jgi:hypothetical protein